MGEKEEMRSVFQTSRKGSIEILVQLGDGPKRFSEIKPVIPISTSTLSRRLKEGVKDGVWEQSLEEQDDGSSVKMYELTQKGEEFYEVAEELDLPEVVNEYLELRAEYNEKAERYTTELLEADLVDQ